MRIVSQDGMVDVPYERVVIRMLENPFNVVISALFEREDYIKDIVMGYYSTKEKALKVMKMVREAYMGLPVVFQNANIDDSVLESFKNHNVVLLKSYDEPQSKVEYVNSGIFQFPKDDEIEV